MDLLAFLDWVYGPAAQSDPYYLLLRDFVILMPWWYPFMWIGGLTVFFSFSIIRRIKWRLSHARGAARVQARTRRLIAVQNAEVAIKRLLRHPANDNRSDVRPTAVA